MILRVINHPYELDMKNLCITFFPHEKISLEGEEDPVVVTTRRETDGSFFVSAKVYDVYRETTAKPEPADEEHLVLSVTLYRLLSGILGFAPPWGVLYGVRPAKLMHRLCAQMGDDAAVAHFQTAFLTQKSKAELAHEVMLHENRSIARSGPKSFSLYVSIPFCPTRCAYCSFVSHSIEKTHKLMTPYVDLLLRELEETSKYAKELGLELATVYFGGGTPTTLSAQDLGRIFTTIEQNFDLSHLMEYTVEAGRPDTVTRERLEVIRAAGVQRISINPQSFNDKVLEAIGRRHTAQQTLDAFALARDCGFDHINMDFIAGLPEDDLPSFQRSIQTALDLQAESITVHTLALKTSAYMVTREQTFDLKDRLTVSNMVDYAGQTLHGAGYYPYYMYRQSKSLGNLENVGWCKPGYDCLYNVYMMDETHTVLAVGAGAVTKLRGQNSGMIERIYNYKYPYEYIRDFDTLLERKKRIPGFYAEYD